MYFFINHLDQVAEPQSFSLFEESFVIIKQELRIFIHSVVVKEVVKVIFRLEVLRVVFGLLGSSFV